MPKIRAVAGRHLSRGATLSRERVLAAAIRLIDLGFFRPGGDEYAAENGSYGLATIRREHVTCSRNGEISFDYIGKSGKQQEQAIVDSDVFSVVRSLKLRRSCPDLEDLLVYRSGKRWDNVTAGDINDYLREISGDDYTAKDFRTWHATVLAAVGLASRYLPPSRRLAASAPSPGSSRRWPATSATPRPWPASPTSTRGSSRSTRKASRSPPPSPIWARARNSATPPPTAAPNALSSACSPTANGTRPAALPC
jgi:DNA topoisomerase-1